MEPKNNTLEPPRVIYSEALLSSAERCTMRTQFMSLILFFVLGCFGVTPAFSWEETSTANILVFDGNGEVTATYHLDDWTTEVNKNQSYIVHQEWKDGSPPTLSNETETTFTVKDGEVALPNIINGASTAPTGNAPAVSLYSFDEAFFSSIISKTPGLTVSQPPGKYEITLALEFVCLPWPEAGKGFAYIEVYEGRDWVRYASPHTVHLVESADLQVRAVFAPVFGTSVMTEKSFAYIINHPAGWNRDSDGDGFPDVWEVANGLDPFSSTVAGSTRKADSDGDGMSDVDELLRGSDPSDPVNLPADTDGDGWSDWDEEIRGTLPDDDLSIPTATRLYEVEVKLLGSLSGGGGSWSVVPFVVKTLGGEVLYSQNSALAGTYKTGRFPMGRESFIRAVQPGDTDGDGATDSDDDFLVTISRYLPMMHDPNPVDVTGAWNTTAEWQTLYEDFLTERLVVTKTGFDVSAEDRPELAVLARMLELEAENSPDTWFGFGSFGHEPSLLAIDEFKTRLNSEKRNINEVIADITLALDSGCLTIRATISALVTSVPKESVEGAAAKLLQDRTGGYIAALLAHYPYDYLNSSGWPLCQLFDPDNDLDNDLLPAYLEIFLQAGDTDPFNSDSDNDEIQDDLDNCPAISNADQKDSDLDGYGDVCDDDDDNDGLTDGIEMAFGSNPFNNDTDGDGELDYDEWMNGTHPGVAIYVTNILSPTNQPNQIVSGYRYSGAAVSVSIDLGAVVGSCTTPDETSWSCEVSNLIDETSYTLQLQASLEGKIGYGTAVIIVDLTSPVIPGDINFDDEVDLKDLIIGLQIMVNLAPETISIDADINNDKQIGVAEIIYILNQLAY